VNSQFYEQLARLTTVIAYRVGPKNKDYADLRIGELSRLRGFSDRKALRRYLVYECLIVNEVVDALFLLASKGY